MKVNEILTEQWSQKYKSSIDCSHPKGFSQKAHCAGKKKHNESIEMEMVCEDCGMCQTHGNINEIDKGEKDSNGYTKCWPGHHAEGTKKGKNGGQVRNCVPNESVAEGKRPDTYHIVNKDGKPANLASYADKESAVKDRDAKHQGAEVRQLGPRGKVKGVSEAHDAAAKEIHGNLFHDSIPPGAEKHHVSAVLKAHGLQDTDAKDVIDRVRKMGYTGPRLGKPEVDEAGSAAQQAAIAINMKKQHKKPKSMQEAEELFDMIEYMVETLAETYGVDAEQIWEDLESFDDDTLLIESAAWHRKAGKSAKGGLNRKGVASYRREHPGSKLQMAVTTKPSKLKPGSKAAKRRKSFCARMSGNKGPMKKPNGEPTRKALALRKWHC
jgi:hypothetical protein